MFPLDYPCTCRATSQSKFAHRDWCLFWGAPREPNVTYNSRGEIVDVQASQGS